MTSARSHQQPLNGNKAGTWSLSFLLISPILLILSSCDLFSGGQGTDPVVIVPVEASEEDPKVNVNPVDPITEPVDTAQPPSEPIERRYRIGLLLPFSLDDRSLSNLIIRDEQKRNRPLIGLGFYEGVLLAKDSLERVGIDLDLLVVDSRNSSVEVSRVLGRSDFDNLDLLIGPVFDKGLSSALSWATQESVPLVSPIRPPSDKMISPWFLSANPGDGPLREAAANYIREAFPQAQVLVIHQETDQEMLMSEDFLSALNANVRDSAREIQTDYKLEELDEALSLAQTNVLVIPSKDEVFVNAAARYLAEKSLEHDLIVFGLQEWRRFESMKPDNLNKIQFHYATSYWVNDSLQTVRDFNNRYRELYHGPPNEFAYRGYDLVLYFGQLLANKHGRQKGAFRRAFDLRDHVDAVESYPNMLDGFSFNPVLDSDGQFKYLSNKRVHIIRYRNFYFESTSTE